MSRNDEETVRFISFSINIDGKQGVNSPTCALRASNGVYYSICGFTCTPTFCSLTTVTYEILELMPGFQKSYPGFTKKLKTEYAILNILVLWGCFAYSFQWHSPHSFWIFSSRRLWTAGSPEVHFIRCWNISSRRNCSTNNLFSWGKHEWV